MDKMERNKLVALYVNELREQGRSWAEARLMGDRFDVLLDYEHETANERIER